MAHIRQQVRDAFEAELTGITGVITLSKSRVRDFSQSECPAINITTSSELIEWLDEGRLSTFRTMTVDVTIFAYGRDGKDATDKVLDDISSQVESRILSAVGSPWDEMVEHRPSAMQFSVGEVAELSLFALQTRFTVRFSAIDAETIG